MVGKWMPVHYAMYYGDLRDIAEAKGYALLMHGSLTRDMDLVLVPWVEEAKPYMEVLREWGESGFGFRRVDGRVWDTRGLKPHGRIAFTMHTGGGGYVDVSVVNGVEEADADVSVIH